MDLISVESAVPLLVRIVRESLSGITPPPFPEELGTSLVLNDRFRLELR